MQDDTVVQSLACPASLEVELVELRLSTLPVLQLSSPEVVSCSQREEAYSCRRCLHDQTR